MPPLRVVSSLGAELVTARADCQVRPPHIWSLLHALFVTITGAPAM